MCRDDKYVNNYRNNVFKVNQIVMIAEYTGVRSNKYGLYKIIKVINKGLYNMYLCEKLINKTRTTITDKDYFLDNIVYIMDDMEG